MRLRHTAVGFGLISSCFVAGVPSAFAVGKASLSTPTNGGWTTSTPRLTWTAASQATSYTLTITPATGTPLVKTGLTTTYYTLTEAEALSTAGGPYTWNVIAYDAVPASSTSSTWSFFVDTTPPAPFALTGPELNVWTKSSNTYVQWEAATDTGSGIAAYHAYIDGVLCRDAVATATSAGMSNACRPTEGVHYWSVSVEDKVGNLTWSSDSPGGIGGRPFRVDDTGPSDPTLTGGVYQLSSNHKPNYYGSPTDHMVDTGINLDYGQEFNVSATGTWCIAGCTLGCYSTDGYYSPTGGGVPVPSCNNASLVGRINIGSNFYCLGGTLTAKTSGKLYLGINSQTAGCWTRTVTATVTGGRQLGLVGPADGIFTTERLPKFTWLPATDQGSGAVRYHVFVELVTTGNAVLQFMSTTTTDTIPEEPLADGTYDWTVSATDAVSNPTSAATRRLTVDTLRPDAFTLSTPGDNTCTTIPTPSLCSVGGTDTNGIASRELWIDGVLAVAGTSACATPNAALAQGTHNWFVVLTDAAGNKRQSSDTRNFVVDYTAPSVAPTLLSPATQSQSADPPVFTWSAANDNVGIKAYELYVDGTLKATLNSKTLSYTSPTEFAAGAHTWYVRALDQCDQAAQSATFTFTVTPCTMDGLAHPCPGYTLGLCRPGTRICTAPGTWSACSDVVKPATETCNNADDDCDGVIDNGTGSSTNNQCGGICSITPPYIGSNCDGPDVDQCTEGRLVCAGLNSVVCAETTPNNVETCNGRDDDCNGRVDDGAVCGNTGTGGAGGSTSSGTGGSSGVATGGATALGQGGGNGNGGSVTQGGQIGSSLGGIAGALNTSPVGGVANSGGAGGTNGLATGGTDATQGGQSERASAGTSTKVKSTGGNSVTSHRGGNDTGKAGEASDQAGNAGDAANESSQSESGCSCHVASSRPHVQLFALFGILALAIRRRRERRR